MLYFYLALSWTGLILYTLFFIPRSGLKWSFIYFAISTVLYAGFSICMNYEDLSNSNPILVLWGMRLVFTCGLLTLSGTCLFLLYLVWPDKIKYYFVLIILIVTLILTFLTSFTKLLIQDIVITQNLIVPVFGPGRYIYIVGFCVLFVTCYFIFLNAMHKSTDPLLLFQMRWIGYSIAFSFGGIILTNLIYPLITGSHRLSYIGPILVLFPPFVIALVLTMARRMIFLKMYRHELNDIQIELLHSLNRILDNDSASEILQFREKKIVLSSEKKNGVSQQTLQAELSKYKHLLKQTARMGDPLVQNFIKDNWPEQGT